MLPPFLSFLSNSTTCSTAPFTTKYVHSQRLGKSEAHCLWWPCKSLKTKPNEVLLFVPGNPGLTEFYEQYLSYIYASAPTSLSILGHSLIGHSPRTDAVSQTFSNLQAQVKGIVEVIDDVMSAFGSSTKLILIGHSVGSWIVFQSLKERLDVVTAAFLLFPTIAHIARTPNGRRLSWLFNGPIPRILSNLSRLLRFLPKRTLLLLFRDWPQEQINVLWSFLNTPSAILASLSMAREEMNTIKDLDLTLLDKAKHKIYFFLAEKDDWVGTNKDTIIREMSHEPHSVRVIHGRHGIPHSYCINHGPELGDQSLNWLKDDILSPTIPAPQVGSS